jgi:hypothetical protein
LFKKRAFDAVILAIGMRLATFEHFGQKMIKLLGSHWQTNKKQI